MKPDRLKALQEAAKRAEEQSEGYLQNQYDIYHERDLLVAVLARVWPSHVMQHTRSPRSHRLMICIHSPFGKLAWSIPPDMLDEYRASAQVAENDWDGCTQRAKRERLHQYAVNTPCTLPPDALRRTT